MNLSRREEAHQPTSQEARSRQTAMEAERHWWVSKLMAYLDNVKEDRTGDLLEGDEFSLERASVKEDVIDALKDLIAERTI